MKKRQVHIWRDDLRVLPAMPLHIWLPLRHPRVTLERLQGDFVFTCGAGITPQQSNKELQIGANVWKIRAEFFEVKTPDQALAFLSSYSDFLILPDDEHTRWTITWTDFKRWQKLLSLVRLRGFPSYWDPAWTEDGQPKWVINRDMSQPPNSADIEAAQVSLEELKDLLTPSGARQELLDWLRGTASGVDIRATSDFYLRLHPGEAKATCHVMVMTVIEALLATIYFEKTVQIKSKLCARKGCDEIFESNNNHDGRFCSKKCAHTQDVRDRRQAAKDEVAKAQRAAAKEMPITTGKPTAKQRSTARNQSKPSE